MVQLRTAFCCFTLRTGNLILGWLNVIGGILAIAFLCLPIWIFEESEREGAPDPETERALQKAIAFLYGMIAVLGVFVIISICQIHASYKRRKEYLLPCLVVSVILLILAFGVSILSYGFGQSSLKEFLVELCTTGVEVYFHLIVWSFYKELRDGKQSELRQPIV